MRAALFPKEGARDEVESTPYRNYGPLWRIRKYERQPMSFWSFIRYIKEKMTAR